MGLLSKIKSALFEEEIEENTEQVSNPPIAEEIKIRHYEDDNASYEYKKEEVQSPVIFDVEDFIEEQETVVERPVQSVEVKQIYGGNEIKEAPKDFEKERFTPSPIISPVYGILDKNYTSKEHDKVPERKSLDQLFSEEKSKSIDLDSVRQKAYGEKQEPEVDEISEEANEVDQGLLYEMQSIEDKPGIEKISIGDAEEYFEDLGLEYNIDYTDLAKQKMTRTKKNQNLAEEIDEEIKENSLIEEELKYQEKPTSEDSEEKNLYDLIDMMYDK